MIKGMKSCGMFFHTAFLHISDHLIAVAMLPWMFKRQCEVKYLKFEPLVTKSEHMEEKRNCIFAYVYWMMSNFTIHKPTSPKEEAVPIILVTPLYSYIEND